MHGCGRHEPLYRVYRIELTRPRCRIRADHECRPREFPLGLFLVRPTGRSDAIVCQIYCGKKPNT
jgi:hypothetical protein